MLQRLVTVLICGLVLTVVFTILMNHVFLPSFILPRLTAELNTPHNRFKVRRVWYRPWSGIHLKAVGFSMTFRQTAPAMRLSILCPHMTVRWPWASLSAPGRLGLPVIDAQRCRAVLTNAALQAGGVEPAAPSATPHHPAGGPLKPADARPGSPGTRPMRSILDGFRQRIRPFGALNISDSTLDVRLPDTALSFHSAELKIEADWLKRASLRAQAVCREKECPVETFACRGRLFGSIGKVEGACDLSQVHPRRWLPLSLAGRRLSSLAARRLWFVVTASDQNVRLRTLARDLTLHLGSDNWETTLERMNGEAVLVARQGHVRAHGTASFDRGVLGNDRWRIALSGEIRDLTAGIDGERLSAVLVPSFNRFRFRLMPRGGSARGAGASDNQTTAPSGRADPAAPIELTVQSAAADKIVLTARRPGSDRWRLGSLRVEQPRFTALRLDQNGRSVTARTVRAQSLVVPPNDTFTASPRRMMLRGASVSNGQDKRLAFGGTVEAAQPTASADSFLLTLHDVSAGDVGLSPNAAGQAAAERLHLRSATLTARSSTDEIGVSWNDLSLESFQISSPQARAHGNLVVSGRVESVSVTNPSLDRILQTTTLDGSIAGFAVDLTPSENRALRRLKRIEDLTGRMTCNGGWLSVRSLTGVWRDLPLSMQGRLRLVPSPRADPPESPVEGLVVNGPELDLVTWAPQLIPLLPETLRGHPWRPQFEAGRLRASLVLDDDLLVDPRAPLRLTSRWTDVRAVVPAMDFGIEHFNASVDCDIRHEDCVGRSITLTYHDIPITVNGTLHRFSRPKFSLTGRIRDIAFDLEGLRRPPEWIFSKIKIAAGSSFFEGRGRWIPETRRPLRLSGEWRLSLDDLVRRPPLNRYSVLEPTGTISGSADVMMDPSVPESLRADGVFDVHSLSIKTFVIKTARVTLRPQDTAQTLILDIPLPVGRIQCTGDLVSEPGTETVGDTAFHPFWRARCRAENVSLQTVLKQSPWKDKPYEGKISADIRLAGRFGETASIEGEGVLSVTQGKLWESSLLKGVWKVLLLTPELSNLRFHALETRFRWKRKQLLLDDLIVHAPALDLVGGGRIDLNGSIDLALRPVIKEVELIKSDSLRAGASRVFSELTAGQILIRIQGPLTDPKITKTLSKQGVVSEAGAMIVDTLKTLIEDLLP